jgi:hypothetical protein
LLELIAEEVVDLLVEVDRPTAGRFALTSVTEVDPRVLLFHCRRLMSESWLPSAVDLILQCPHAVIRAREENRPIWAALLPAPDLIPARVGGDFDYGGPLSHLFRGYTPRTLPEIVKRETLDTNENRFVKSFLEELALLTTSLAAKLRRAGLQVSAKEAWSWYSRISDWLAHPLWRDVGPPSGAPTNSQVLQRAAGYRDVLAAELALTFGIRLPWERGLEIAGGLDGDLRPISELYEYWCFFVIRAALREICGEAGTQVGSLIIRSRAGVSLNLRQGREARTEFTYLRGDRDAKTTLFYNRRFRQAAIGGQEWNGSYSSTFRPDFSVLVEVESREGRRRSHWLHFDAKYRLELMEWETAVGDAAAAVEGDNLGLQERYRRENLDEMHSYRDALLGSRGAYILFPGSGRSEDIFIRFPGVAYPDSLFFFPSVGAFQLRPSSQSAQRERLRNFLRSVLDQLLEDAPYTEETGLFQ